MVWRPTALWSGQASIQTDSFLSETGVFRRHVEGVTGGRLRTLAPNPQFD
jgi:hypothetical protein